MSVAREGHRAKNREARILELHDVIRKANAELKGLDPKGGRPYREFKTDEEEVAYIARLVATLSGRLQTITAWMCDQSAGERPTNGIEEEATRGSDPVRHLTIVS